MPHIPSNRFGGRAIRRAATAALVLAAALAQAGGLCAQQSPSEAVPPAAASEPGAALAVYLMTMGPGDSVWERFGHNAIWVRDAESGTDKAYNYGLFDFQQENFLWRFIQGRMLYWMEGFDAAATAALYQRDNRSVWVQELNLTPAQRAALREFLEWNELPENRHYRYDYYRDNCSTRVRDALDRALGGRLRAATENVAAGVTYRSHTRRLTADDLPIYTGLLLGLADAADRPISAWEEMFLPLKMREHVRRITVTDESGAEVPLVKGEWTMFAADRAAGPEEPPGFLIGYLTAGLLLGGLFAGLGRLGRRRRPARLAFAALGALWALSFGLFGVVLAGLWGVTDHVVAYRNENLLQVNPLGLALAVLVPALALRRRWAAGPALWLAGSLAALAALGLVLKALPAFDQVNGPIIALALPAHLGAFLGVADLARGAGVGPGPEGRSGRPGRDGA